MRCGIHLRQCKLNLLIKAMWDGERKGEVTDDSRVGGVGLGTCKDEIIIEMGKTGRGQG